MAKRIGSTLVAMAMGMAVVASLGGCGKRPTTLNDVTPKPKAVAGF